MDKIYIQGKSYIPEKDILLCDIQKEDPAIRPMNVIPEYERLYATEQGAFYLIRSSTSGKTAAVISMDDAMAFLQDNPAYIITDNYDLIFGEPERG